MGVILFQVEYLDVSGQPATMCSITPVANFTMDVITNLRWDSS